MSHRQHTDYLSENWDWSPDTLKWWARAPDGVVRVGTATNRADAERQALHALGLLPRRPYTAVNTYSRHGWAVYREGRMVNGLMDRTAAVMLARRLNAEYAEKSA